MPLEPALIGKQIAQMGQALKARQGQEQDRLDIALTTLRAHAKSHYALCRKIEGSQPAWAVARPVEDLDARYRLPQGPTQYRVIATDGSQIEPDRHGAVLCHVVNTGAVVLEYATQPRGLLSSDPRLYYEDGDVYIEHNRRMLLVQGRLLDVKRNVAEMEKLADLSETHQGGLPTVGLQDGTLVMRSGGEGGMEDPTIRTRFLPKFRDSVERLEKLGVALAAYVSRPRTYDVVGALRVAMCNHPAARCQQYCGLRFSPGKEPCGPLQGLADRHVFAALPLADGERSALFQRQAQNQADLRGSFFYLNVGQELARVEVAQWVAASGERLALVHRVAYDQCQRGDGYPRALIEAHEKAVLTTGDRQQFERLLFKMLANQGLSSRLSQKERSKHIRGL